MVSTARPRLLIGQIWQETNSFNPLPTNGADFVVERGPDVVAQHGSAGSPLGGIIRAAREAGLAIIPTLAARARPGGAVDHAFYASLVAEIVEAAVATRPDLGCLDLHGARQTSAVDDSEGLMLEALRTAVGTDVPIGVALDLHGHVTPAMVAAADFLAGYHTNPHADMAETGMRALRGVLDVLSRRTGTTRYLARIPMLLLEDDETSTGPLVPLHAERERLLAENAGDVLDVSVFNTQPLLDVPGIGQSVVVVAKAGSTAGGQAALALADRLWESRSAFKARRATVEDCIALARTPGTILPLILGDVGDRVLGGAPGDSTFILGRLAASAPELRVFAPVYDPAAVRDGLARGLRSRLRRSVGAGVSGTLSSLDIDGTVIAVGDGRIKNIGAYMTGVAVDLGACVLVEQGRAMILLTEKPPQVQDPAVLLAFGLHPSQFDVVVVKSSNHFKLSFEGLGTCVSVDTPGLSTLKASSMPFARIGAVHPIRSDVAYVPDLLTFGVPILAEDLAGPTSAIPRAQAP